MRSLSAGWIQLGYTARSYRHKVWTTRMNTQVLTNKSGEIFLSIFIFFRFSFYTDARLPGVSGNSSPPVIPGNTSLQFPPRKSRMKFSTHITVPGNGNGIFIFVPVPQNWKGISPCIHVPESWEWNFPLGFPFPKNGNGICHFPFPKSKSHSRSWLPKGPVLTPGGHLGASHERE